MKQITITTSLGTIKGIEENNIEKFLGVRYATAGRWEYPTIVETFEGTYDATDFGASSMQKRSFYKEQDDSFYYNEFRKGEQYSYSEDCFFLNIWKPINCDNAPIIFYIHGGAFQGGCGNEKHFDGTKYAQNGVIFITCNYRLGPFGFCSLPELKEESGHTGNYGLYDQLAAFHWVKKYIKDFGGNPENITLMGQSAGAMSIQQFCNSPMVRDEIKKAIMTSGGGISQQFTNCIPVEEAYPFWREVLSRFGNTLEEWRKIDPKVLLDTMFEVAQNYEYAIQYFSPVIDNQLIAYTLDEAKEKQIQAPITYIMGATKDDMAVEVIYKMAKEWTIRQSCQGLKPSYCFYFGRNLPGDEKGAWHSSELWYTIGTLGNCWRPMTDWDYKLSDTFISYFTNYAKTGNPNGEGLPQWLPTTETQQKVMVFDDNNIDMKEV